MDDKTINKIYLRAIQLIVTFSIIALIVWSIHAAVQGDKWDRGREVIESEVEIEYVDGKLGEVLLRSDCSLPLEKLENLQKVSSNAIRETGVMCAYYTNGFYRVAEGFVVWKNDRYVLANTGETPSMGYKIVLSKLK